MRVQLAAILLPSSRVRIMMLPPPMAFVPATPILFSYPAEDALVASLQLRSDIEEEAVEEEEEAAEEEAAEEEEASYYPPRQRQRYCHEQAERELPQ
jgi:hypothetical protein